MSFIIQAAGVLAPIVLAVSYIPQIINLYKTKSIEGIALSFWLILDFSLLLLFILAVDSAKSTGDYSLFIAQALNLILALVVTVQVIYYGKKNKSENN